MSGPARPRSATRIAVEANTPDPAIASTCDPARVTYSAGTASPRRTSGPPLTPPAPGARGFASGAFSVSRLGASSPGA
jgi:hypothetical protein